VSAGDGELLAAFAEAEPREQAADPGAPYPEILARVFGNIEQRWGVEPDRGEAERFGASISDWPAFPDSAAALDELEQRYRLVVLSNVDRASFRLSNDRLGVEFDLVVTAQDVGSYKPAPGHFRRALELLAERGVAQGEVLHTAQSLYHDIEPAHRLGLATAWINRRGGVGGATRAPDEPDLRPDFEAPSLAAFAELVRRDAEA
ncbi:MAG: HAD-IA family hydrolase, partial [Dehalococcoidia bacterium]